MRKSYSGLKAVCLIAWVGLFASCAKHPTFFVDKDWKSVDPNGGVAVYITKPQIANPDDIVDDMPGEAPRFSDWLARRLGDGFAASTQSAVSLQYVPDNTVKMEPEVLGGLEATAPRPASYGKEALTICVSPFRILRFSETTPGSYMPGMNGAPGYYVAGSTYNALRFEGEYAIYDSKSGKRLAFGKFQSDASFSFHMNGQDWLKSADGMPASILKGTPFLAK